VFDLQGQAASGAVYILRIIYNPPENPIFEVGKGGFV
jgi:hypothetical protein